MENEIVTTTLRITLALIAGALIGLERAHHGHSAGIRTHALVCMSSSLLMLLAVFQWELIANAPTETIRIDPTRMAQGLMTGIGFLGAGVILKESLTIRGLTTAASIWMTASVGVVIGMGLYFAAGLTLIFTLMVLTLFRAFENHIPVQRYAHLTVRFSRLKHLSEQELQQLISDHNIRCFDMSYMLENEGKHLQYEMTIRTTDSDNYRELSTTLAETEIVMEFALRPTGN